MTFSGFESCHFNASSTRQNGQSESQTAVLAQSPDFRGSKRISEGLGFRVFILLKKRPSLPSVVGGNDLLGASIYSYEIPTP